MTYGHVTNEDIDTSLTFDERCRVYCGCEKCDIFPLGQTNYQWTMTQLNSCRFDQFKTVICIETEIS